MPIRSLAPIVTILVLPLALSRMAGAQEAYYLHQGEPIALQRAPLQLSLGVVDSGAQPLPEEEDALTVLMGPRRWRVDLALRSAHGQPLTRAESLRRALARQDAVLARYRAQPEVSWAYPGFIQRDSGALLFPTSRVILKVADLAERELRASLPSTVRLVRRLRVGSGIYLIELVEPRTSDPLATANDLSRQNWVAWAEPDFVQDWHQNQVPNDTLYPDQWHSSNDGSLGSPPGTPGADARLQAAWDIQTGDGSVTIAVIDDGVQLDHPDLMTRIFINPDEIPNNGTDDDSNGFIDDVNGWDFVEDDNDPNPFPGFESHGTAVAGVAAAAGNNGIGVSGGCLNCRILPVRVAANGFFIDNAGIAEGISYAASFGDVLNNSWGGGSVSSAIDAAIVEAVTNGRDGLGSPTVFSTGNAASAYYRLQAFASWSAGGTYTFEWTFAKNESLSVGQDRAFLDNVVFPDGSVEDFENGARTGPRGTLPSGWSSFGDAPWSLLDDGTRASSGRGGSRALASGAITDDQTSGVRITKTLATVDVRMTYMLWADSETSFEDGIGPSISNLCLDGTQLKVYDETTTVVYTGPVRCGTWSNQLRPLEDGTIGYPASHPETIAVGSATNFDHRSDYSQWGSGLDFLAHSSGGSVGITTTDVTGEDGYSTTDYTDDFGGTSSAAPLAAGIAALYLTSNPTATAAEVRAALQGATREIGPVPYVRSRNDQYGHGVLDASALLSGGPTVFQDGFEDGTTDKWTNQVP